MIKATSFALMAAATPVSGESKVLAIVVIIAAVFLTLNSLGVLPRGKTADRLKLDLDVAEKELAKATTRNTVLEAKLERLPNLESHEKILAGMLKSLQDHDTRMHAAASDLTKLADRVLTRLDLIEIAVTRKE